MNLQVYIEKVRFRHSLITEVVIYFCLFDGLKKSLGFTWRCILNDMVVFVLTFFFLPWRIFVLFLIFLLLRLIIHALTLFLQKLFIKLIFLNHSHPYSSFLLFLSLSFLYAYAFLFHHFPQELEEIKWW